MAGGLFKDVPFRFNIKCVIFSAILMAAFAMTPVRSIPVMLAIPWIAALFILSYHRMYRCSIDSVPRRIFGITAASLALMTAYWFTPERTRREWVMYLFIFVYGYVGMAFYDYAFDCSTLLQSGFLSFTAPFKPR